MKVFTREPFDLVAMGEVWTVFSDAVQDFFRIWIVPPERGWSGPVDMVIATDAPTMGGMLAGLLTAGRASGELPPAFGIAIGYPDDGAPHRARRIRDLTPTRNLNVEDWEAARLGSGPVSSGGADEFLTFLGGELRAALLDNFRLEPLRWMLVGSSYGGLFAAHALLRSPELFDSYLLISPALWWDDRVIVRCAEQSVALAHVEDGAGPRVFLCAGGCETRAKLDTYLAGLPDTARGKIPAMVRNADILSDMVGFADALAVRLSRNTVEARVLPGFGHGTVIAPALALGLHFLLS